MTAPRARERRAPNDAARAPPDRRPPRRGGGSSPSAYAASAAGRATGFARLRVTRHGLVRSARALAAAVLLALSGALALPATAQAQNVSEPPGEDLPDDATTTGRVAVGGSVTGAIGVANDIDAFAVDLVQGLNYRIDVEGVDTSQGTLADPALLGVYRVHSEGDFDLIATHTRDFDSGDGRNAQIAFTLGTRASGTYYLLVTSQLDTTGTYRLSVRVLHPGKPTNLSATANGSMQIDLSWDAPADDGGSAITGYKIEVSTTGGTRWTVLVPDTGNDDTEYSHTGLSPGDTRTYRVSAINVHGTSEASDSDYATTPVEVTLHLSETSTLENDPAVTVTATAWPPSRVPYTVTVSASPVAPATVDDFELSTNRVLSFARNATESTGTVTIRMVDDDEREPNDVVRVSGAVSNAAIPDPDDVTLTILNDDTGPPPTVTSVVVASAPQSGNTYHWGETIVFTVTFNEPVRVTGRPGLEVGLDDPAGVSGSTVRARFWGLSESQRPTAGTRPVPVSRHVHFAYTVQPFDRDTDGLRIGADALRLASADRIQRDGTDVDAELDRTALGPQTGHRVDGRTTVDGEPVAEAGITFVDGNDDLLETRADGNHRLWVPEGGEARYGLRLKTRPAKSVVLSFHPQAGDADLDVPRNYSSDRSIAPDEWGAKTTVWVRVAAAQDVDAENGERVFENRAFSNDPNYHDLALPDVVAVEVDDEPPCTLNPGDIWCGVVTLGIQILPGGDASYGFSPYFGQLSDDSGDRSFTYGTNTYTVGSLLREGVGGEAVLVIRLTSHLAEADRAKLVLHIGSASFAFSDASVSTDDYSSDENYLWGSDLDWSRESYVILRLREASSAQRALQGRFVSPPERHDGKKRIKVRVEFSEPVEESPENVGAHGVEVEGGEVTSVSAVGGDAPDGAGTRSVGGRNAGQQDREVVWEFEIEPDSDGDLTISLDAGRPCGEPGAICTADGRSLSEGISTTVEGPDTGPPPLTASFEDMPEAHDGERAFRFRVAFSEDIGISYRALREDALAVTGGRVTRGARVDDRRDLFEMTVEPDGAGDVTVTLPAGRDGAAGSPGRSAPRGRTAGSSPARRSERRAGHGRTAGQHAGGDGGRPGGGDRRGGADGGVRGHAVGAPRRGRVPLPGGVQREHRDQLPQPARGRVHGDRRAGHGRQARGRPAGSVRDDGAARLARERDDRAAGGARMRGLRCDLHQGGEPAAAHQHADGDGAGSGGALGGGRAGARGIGCDARLRGDAEPGVVGHGGGGLCDRRRQRDGGLGLHGAEGPADLRSGRDGEDGLGAGAGRRP